MANDGLHKRKSGRWYFTIPKSLSTDGRSHEESTKTDDYKKAKAIRQQRLEEIRRGEAPTDMAEWTVKEAVAHWLQFRQDTEAVRPSTLRLNRELSHALIRLLGGKRLRDIAENIAVIRQYQATRRKEGVAARTVNLELRPLIHAMRDANLWHKIENRYSPLRQERSTVGRAITIEQRDKLLAVAASKREWRVAYLCAQLALNTGMRGGEIKQLRLGDIISEGPAIRIRREGTKTAAGARDVPLNNEAAQAVCNLIAYANLCGSRKAEHYLIPADLDRQTKKYLCGGTDCLCKGKGCERGTLNLLYGRRGFDPTRPCRTIRTAWRRIVAAAGLPGLRFHDLRHTAISRMVSSGIPIPAVMKVVGHLNLDETLGYSHTTPDETQAAVRTLSNGGASPSDVASAIGQVIGIEKGFRKLRKAAPL